MPLEIPAHVEALRHRLGGSVKLVQTHASYVLITEDEVWKLKKPVILGFLDYSSIERRREMCEAEVRLNQRLAGDTYLGVEPIGATGDFADDPIDYAVRMKRLPEDLMLDSVLARGAAEQGLAEMLGRQLADFHAGARVSAEKGNAALAHLWGHWEDNLSWIARMPGLFDRRLVEQVRAYVEEFRRANAELLAERHRRHTVEGHGDLRAEHICLLDEPLMFDCLEFSEELRTIDSASDLAFLLMDLELQGERGFADALTASYLYWSRDATLGVVLDFYRSYRASVRAKVEAIRSQELEVSPSERVEATRQAVRCLYLSRHYARQTRLVFVHGYSGGGKSTIAARLAAAGGMILLSTDLIRKELAGIPANQTIHAEGYGRGIYEPDVTREVYKNMTDAAAEYLISGRSVVLDGTFLGSVGEAAAERLRQRWPGPIAALLVKPAERTLEENFRRRLGGADISDAGLEIYRRQRLDYPEPGLLDCDAVVIDETTRDLSGADLLALLPAGFVTSEHP